MSNLEPQKASAWAVVIFAKAYGPKPVDPSLRNSGNTQGLQATSRTDIWAVTWVVVIPAEISKCHIPEKLQNESQRFYFRVCFLRPPPRTPLLTQLAQV